ncbi:MAG: hypothetical protein ACYTXC_15565 [Nostoc sp.]
MLILSCDRLNRKVSLFIHAFVVMGGDRPTNECNHSGEFCDRF